MGRFPCCPREGLRRGAWTVDEDMILCEYIRTHGDGGWTNIDQKTGLKRGAKSCRLRWVNYLRPHIKHGNISPDEEDLIIRLHRLLGNRWSLIAGRLPQRTDNEIKNYWNTHLSRTLAWKESQPKTANVKKRPKSSPLLEHHVFKPTPVKITTAVRHSPKGCNGDGSNEATILPTVKETMDSSRPWCHLLPSYSDKIVETEGRNSTCSNSSLADQRFPHSDHYAGQAATLAESLLSPHCNLLYSERHCSLIDFGSQEFYTGQLTLAADTNEFESHQSNMESLVSFTIAHGQLMEEFDNIPEVDWTAKTHELQPE